MPKTRPQTVLGFNHRDIAMSMELVPDSAHVLYTIECKQCPHGCVLNFTSQKGFSFASVVKFGAVFCSLCKVMAARDAQMCVGEHVGQQSLMSLVSGSKDEG